MIKTVIILIPVLLVGGSEVQTLSLVNVITNAGYRTIVCCYYEYDQGMVKRFEAAGAKVLLMKYEREESLWHLLLNLLKLFRTLNPDIVHIQYIAPGFVPILAAKLARIKTIFATVHQPGSPYGLKAKFLLRTAAKVCTAFFCNSLAVEKSWFGSAQLYQHNGARRQRHCTIHNAVDTEAIAKAVSGSSKAELRFQLDLGDGPIIGVIGRLRSEKGQALLIETFPDVLKKFPNAQLLIVGDGPDRKSFELRAELLNLTDRIIWLGKKSPEKVYQLYSVIDIVVVPSVFEGFSLAAAEAMAAGVPVVGSNVGGLAEVVEDGLTGILVPQGNSGALATALIELLSDKDKADKMGRMGQVRARQRFSLDIFSQNMIGAYRVFDR